jgi:uncharacterized membrane protein (DUF373 family)
MVDAPSGESRQSSSADSIVNWYIVVVEYAIVASLLLVASIVLVHTLIDFLSNWGEFSQEIVAAIDGILVVIILLDIAHTVFGYMRSSAFPVRPFLVIGILAGVRDILSARASFNDTLISLGVGVGVVVFLLLGLLILRLSQHSEEKSGR